MRYLLISIFYAFISPLFAQEGLSGRVVDSETGEGLIGAHVYSPENWRNGVITGLEGAFSLQGAVQETELVVTYVGYREFNGVLEDGLVELKPVVLKGEEVVVTAAPLVAEEFNYAKISKLEIYTNPAAKADPILAVNSLPSATTTDESANISLRGSSAIETGTFLNNVPVYDAVRYSQLNGIGTFSIFNTSIMQEVSVFPGNPPLEFGSTTAGVIALKTDEAILPESATSAIVSLANIGVSRQQKINESQSIKLFSNWQPSAAIKAVNREALNEIQSFKSGDLGIYWYGATDSYSWKVLNYSVLEGYKFQFEHPSFSGIFDQQKVRSFLISTLEFDLKQGSITLNNGLSASSGNYNYSSVDFETQSQDLFFGVNYLLSKDKWSVKSGVSFDFRTYSTTGSFHLVDYALGEDHPTIDFDDSEDVLPLEGFVYGKYLISAELTLGGGLRKNLPFDNQPDYLSRQINLSYVKDRLTVIIGSGRYHKLGFFENGISTFFSMSRQTSVDVQYKWSDTEVAVSFFDKNAVIDGLEYEVQGWELFGRKNFSKRLRGSASMTLLNAFSESESPYLYDINYFFRASLAYRSRNFWNIEMLSSNRQGILTEQVTEARLDAAYQVYEPTAWNTERLPDYFNLGLSLSKMFLLPNESTLLAFASFNNLLNYDNVRAYAYNFDYTQRSETLFSQRTGYVGIVLNF